MTRLSALLLLGVLLGPDTVAAQSETAPTPATFDGSLRTARNPGFLRAVEVLERRERGRSPRVRFEWEQLQGVAEYVLRGKWIETGSWATRSVEVRVTPRSATTTWDGHTVTIELPLLPGAHSWSVVALWGREVGDFANPARHSFELR